MSSIYLNRYAWPGPAIHENPSTDTGLIVVIPCYHEPDIIQALKSLQACSLPDFKVEVIIVVNYGEDETDEIKEFNINSAEQVSTWIAGNKKDGLSYYLISAFDLPKKHAGVGLARKIGMDEAARRYEGISKPKGIIACFDADCTCAPNYLTTVTNFFQQHPETNAAVVHFEHPLAGDLEQDIYDGIINYEIHLRYYRNALEYALFPFSFHTIGSCMTVPSDVYQKQGGMNRRKAGEDFYFLQKIFPLGNCYNISATTIYPSPRPSHRVPFGTGKAVQKFLKDPLEDFHTYHPNSFEDLKCLMEMVPVLYKKELNKVLSSLPASMVQFLKHIEFESALAKINNNSSSIDAFTKSFFQKFNGFTALKFIHFARDTNYPDVDVLDAAKWVLAKRGGDKEIRITSKMEALRHLRQLDKSSQVK